MKKWFIQFKNSIKYSFKRNIKQLEIGKAYRLYEGGYINDKTYRKILDSFY